MMSMRSRWSWADIADAATLDGDVRHLSTARRDDGRVTDEQIVQLGVLEVRGSCMLTERGA